MTQTPVAQDVTASDDAPAGVSTQLTSSLRSAGIAWVTCGLFVILSITTDGFLRLANLRNILDQQGLILIAASFATLVVIAGGFDISQAAVAILSAIIAVRTFNATNSIILGIAAGMGMGLIVGLINGLMFAKLYIDSFITTLATSFAWFGIAFLASDRSILRPDNNTWIELARTRVFGLTTLTWISFAVVARSDQFLAAAGCESNAALAGLRLGWYADSHCCPFDRALLATRCLVCRRCDLG